MSAFFVKEFESDYGRLLTVLQDGNNMNKQFIRRGFNMARKKGSGRYEIHINVMLTQEMRDLVEQEAQRLSASASTVVRLALLSYFEGRKQRAQ